MQRFDIRRSKPIRSTRIKGVTREKAVSCIKEVNIFLPSSFTKQSLIILYLIKMAKHGSGSTATLNKLDLETIGLNQTDPRGNSLCPWDFGIWPPDSVHTEIHNLIRGHPFTT